MQTSTNTSTLHIAHAVQAGKHKHLHKNTCSTCTVLSTHTSTYALCSTVHKNKHKHFCTKAGTRQAAVGSWQEGKERQSAAWAAYMQR